MKYEISPEELVEILKKAKRPVEIGVDNGIGDSVTAVAALRYDPNNDVILCQRIEYPEPHDIIEWAKEIEKAMKKHDKS